MASPARILVVEDEWAFRNGLGLYLRGGGYDVAEAESVKAGWEQFRSYRPDLVILDVGLPDGSGQDLCRQIRSHAELAKTPVIMLTAEARFEEKNRGFDAGADHYLTKPMKPEEVLLWVRALLRRGSYAKEEPALLQVGDLTIDVQGQLLRYAGTPIQRLTRKEFELLCFLVKNRPRALSRKHILTTLWKTVVVDHAVNFHVNSLRRKLPAAVANRIQTVSGKGYRFLE